MNDSPVTCDVADGIALLTLSDPPANTYSYERQQQLFESEDAREGLAAHLEKRKPVFKGR